MLEINPNRKIIHVDMDAFYASVEQMDNPDLRGKPVAVGGNEIRGVVSAASYEARKFGVRSALSGALAKKYCPELIFVRPRFDRYKEISQKIRKIFYDYTDLVEPLSLDEAYLEDLPIRKFYGVGKVTTEKMYQLGIFTGLDLKSKPIEFLEKHFGKSGTFYFNVVRGIHNSEVKPNRITKSVAAEHTFDENLTSEIFMQDRLETIAAELDRRLKKHKIAGKTVTLKIKYSDFTQQTRSKTLPYFISDQSLLFDTVKELLFQERMKDSVRLLGISLSNLNTEIKKTIVVQLKFDF